MNKEMLTDMNLSLTPSEALVSETRERISQIPARKRTFTTRRVGIAATALCAAAVLCVGVIQSDMLAAINSGSLSEDGITTSGTEQENKIFKESETTSSENITAAVTNTPAGKETVPASASPWLVPDVDHEPNETSVALHDEIYRIPRWDEKKIYEKYTSFNYNGKEYCAVPYLDCGNVPASKLSAPLGTVSASGYDVYEDKTHSITASIHGIKGVSTDYAVAIKLDDSGKYYSFKNETTYSPASFDQLVKDLSLKDNLSVEKIYKEHEDNHDMDIYLPKNSDDIVNKLCELGAAPLKNITYYEGGYGKDMIRLSVNAEILGVHYLTMCITGDGYILTNLVSTGAVFYIGKEAAAELTDYALSVSTLEETHTAPTTEVVVSNETESEGYAVTEVFSEGAPMF